MLTKSKWNGRRKGFVLIEAIVALTILALVWGACFRVVSTSPAALKKSENTRLAVLSAKSLLARVGVEKPLQPGSWSGELKGGGVWQLAIFSYKQPLNHNDGNIGEKGGVVHPYIVQIRTSYGTGRSKAVAFVETIKRESDVN